MKSRIPVGLVMMLVALVMSFIPAATITAHPVAAQSVCDWAQFIADVTVPDGTSFSPGATFTKTWRLKNIGTCTWTSSYSLAYSSGDQMGGPSSAFLPSNVAPGQTVDLSLTLTAPSNTGHYIGYWKLRNASGAPFGIGSSASSAWWVEINVTTGGSINNAYDFVPNYCSASWYSTAGSLPCPGTDGDSRGFVLQVNQPTLENGAVNSGGGIVTQPQNVYNGDIHGVFPAFHVLSGDHFQSTINCAYGATSCYVTFRLDYQIGSGPIYTFWSFREKYEGLYYNADINLSSLANQDVKFILTVLATGDAVGDRALWVNPRITRAGGTPPPPPNARNFDFGTSSSPVQSNYTRVTEATAYTSGGFGWTDTSTLESRDRTSQSDALRRDFVLSSSAARTFKADLPNGTYGVTVTMGDQDFAHDNMVVKANGTTVLSDVDSAAGSYAAGTFNVSVTGGSLSLEFSDAGGSDGTWVVNGVSITTGSPPPAACDRAQFIADVTIPDGTTFAPGAAFTKTWRLKNVGSCTWTSSYAMIFDTGDKMSGPDSVVMPATVAPGQTVDVSVPLVAPNTAGSYRGYWKFKNANGVPFGIGSNGTQSWWVDVHVSGTPPPSTRNFDFGTASSPVASGYTRITETSTYTPGGYGWTETTTLESRDRSNINDDLRRDFVMSASAARIFDVTLPNGTYSVTVIQGDQDFAHDNMVVKANGTTVLTNVSTAATSFASGTFSVTVSTGLLSLEFSDAGGSDPAWVVNGVTISTTTPPPSGADRAQFIADVTVPDGTTFSPNTTFTKTWRLKNVGTSTWTTSYTMVFDTGAQMGGPASVNLPYAVSPGQTVDMTVTLTAPSSAGSYRGYWKFQNPNGSRFGIGSYGTQSWWVDIRVSGTAYTPTPGTPTATIPPVAGTTYDFAANVCSGVWFSGAGQLPCPGTDGDQRGFVIRVTNPQLENGTVDSRQGLLTYPQNVYNGYIQGIFPPYRVKTGDRFQSIVNCAYGATSCYVVFRLDYQTGSGPINTFWAFVEKYEGQFYQVNLDLSSLAGQDVKFILTVLATGSPTGDRAMWVGPIIFNSTAASATSTPTSPATATPTGTPTVVATGTATATPTGTQTPATATPTPTTAPASTATPTSTTAPTATPTGAPTATPTPGTAAVSIANLSFQPSSLEVKAGTTVTWTNNDNTVHTVTSNSGAFDSGNLAVGSTFSFTFTQTGSFSYHCNIHPSMTGTITVVP